MADVIYLTRGRQREIEEEINDLKTNKRKEIAEKIAEARSYGDLSENAEYDAAREAQGLLEARIYRLEQMISQARIIDPSKLPTDKACILATVTVLNKETGKETEYTLVSPEETDIEQGKIAVSSPVGKALIGKKVGDVVRADIPAGVLTLEILKIRLDV